jgi:hypothetical protein
MTLIVMLEDDLERIERFRSILMQRSTRTDLVVSRSAHDFIATYTVLSSVPDLLALDHDLFTDSPDEPDPGDGRDVAAFLTTQSPVCPILIHSTNASAADAMLYALRDAGWTVDRIAPLGDDWIEAYWNPYAMSMLVTDTPQ